MRRLLLLILVVVLTVAASICWAQIPHRINYQGMLTNNAGEPLNGSFDLTFRIYNDPTAGTLKWGETQYGISVANGLFNVNLGDSTPINLPFDEDYWLGIEVGVYGSLSPRIRLTSVPYAYRAESADTANYAIEAVTAESDSDWIISGNNMYSAVSGNVGIGTASPTSPLTIQPVLGTDIQFASGGGFNADIMASNQFNVGTLNASTLSLVTNNQYRLLVEGGGNVGIGTISPAAKLEVYYDNTYDNSAAIAIDNGVGPPRQDVLDFKFGGITEARIRKATNGELFIGTVDNKSIRFQTNATNRMAIANTGEVGIGTISPTHKLQIVGTPDVFWAGSGSAWVYMRTMGNSTISLGDGDDSARAGFISGDENASGENILRIAACDDAGNCPKYTTFHQSGKVGIGTESPEGALDVSSTTGAFIVPRMTTTQRNALTAVNGMIIYNTTTNEFNFYENGVWVRKQNI